MADENGLGIEIGDKKIGENSKISLNLKTAVWIITGLFGLFFTFFTWIYLDIKKEMSTLKQNQIENFNKENDKINDNYKELINRMDDNNYKLRNDIKGDINIIFNKNAGIPSSNENITNASKPSTPTELLNK